MKQKWEMCERQKELLVLPLILKNTTTAGRSRYGLRDKSTLHYICCACTCLTSYAFEGSMTLPSIPLLLILNHLPTLQLCGTFLFAQVKLLCCLLELIK